MLYQIFSLQPFLPALCKVLYIFLRKLMWRSLLSQTVLLLFSLKKPTLKGWPSMNKTCFRLLVMWPNALHIFCAPSGCRHYIFFYAKQSRFHAGGISCILFFWSDWAKTCVCMLLHFCFSRLSFCRRFSLGKLEPVLQVPIFWHHMQIICGGFKS